MKLLVIIPHYNHADTLIHVINDLKQQNWDILIIDDGSSTPEKEKLEVLSQQTPLINIIYLAENKGKGTAVKTGIEYAVQHQYSHAMQIDADGQHKISDAQHLFKQTQQNPEAVICAQPIYGDDAPKSRLYGRKITNFWNIIHTHSFDIKDGMCGFRIYPTQMTHSIITQKYIGNRMDFDTEILIHLYWKNVEIIWIKTPVSYATDGISHFKGLRDNLQISFMHTRLFFQMCWRTLSGKTHG